MRRSTYAFGGQFLHELSEVERKQALNGGRRKPVKATLEDLKEWEDDIKGMTYRKAKIFLFTYGNLTLDKETFEKL